MKIVGYYKINYGDGLRGGWEYYRVYEDNEYFFWNTSSIPPGWHYGGTWSSRLGKREATPISKLELVVMFGIEAIDG